MHEPMNDSGEGGVSLGSEVRSRARSTAQGRLTPVPLALENPASQNELPAVHAEPIPNELLHLWALLTQRETWRSLVVVPAQPGASGLEAGRAIVAVGNQYRERPLRLVNAEGLRPGAASRLVNDIRSHVEQGGMIVTCIDSILTNPVGLEVALAAERALLCVPLGSTQFAAARLTLGRIGKERFLGSVCTRPTGR